MQGNLCPPVQSAETGTRLTSSKTTPGKVPDMQDAVKASELVATRFHIENQVDRNSHKILIPKGTPVCPQNSKSGLQVKQGDTCVRSTS